MAIETTALGFKKPDGNEPIRDGNDVIAANAQTAQDLLADVRARVIQVEHAAGYTGTGLDLADAVVAPLLDQPTSQVRVKLDARYVDETANTAALAGKVDKNTTVNVRDYAVVLDGTAPTGSALVNAISAANILGLPLRLPKGRYLFDQVNLPNNTTIEGSGPDTVIVQRVATQPTFMSLGSTAALGPLTADLAKGATVINVTQSWGLVAGDKIVVSDGFSYAATDAGYKSGEMLTVASSTGTTITLASPVRGSFSNTAGSYTVANTATLTKLNMVKNITLRNMAFEGHAAGTANMLRFQCVDGVTLEGVSTVKGQAGFCLFDNCYDVDVSRYSINGLVDNWASGYPGYGFIIKQASFLVSIRDGFNTMSRHTITTIGGALGAPRNMTFSGLVSDDTTSTAAIDTHSAGENILITGNIIMGAIHGVAVRARNVTVTSNRISNTVNNGILVNENARDVLIAHNHLVACNGYGIRVGASNSPHVNVEVSRNTIADTTGDAISAGVGHTDLRVISNTITRANKYGIDVHAGSSDVLIARNDLTDASLVGTQPGINVTGTQVAGRFDIIANNVNQKAALMNRAIYTTRTQGRMTGNRAYGTYLSAGTEFNAGAGFTNADNVLYA